MRGKATPTAGDEARTLRAQAQLLELVPEAILVREVGTAPIVYWNRGAEELYGWPRAEALGRVSHDLLRTEFPCALGEIEAALAEHGRWEGELRQTTRNGRSLRVLSRWAVQRDQQGQPIAYLEVN